MLILCGLYSDLVLSSIDEPLSVISAIDVIFPVVSEILMLDGWTKNTSSLLPSRELLILNPTVVTNAGLGYPVINST